MQQFRNFGLVGAGEAEKRLEKMVVCGLRGAKTHPGYFPRGVEGRQRRHARGNPPVSSR